MVKNLLFTFGTSLAILLIYSFFADKAGFSGIIGAFIAGILIGQNVRSKKIIEDVIAIWYGFFIPLFFVWVGSITWEEASTDVSAYVTIGIFALIIITISIVGKILGCGIGAKLAGMSGRESLQIGVGMIPRMELALIISTAAVSKGILENPVVAHQILVVTVVLTIFTTILRYFESVHIVCRWWTRSNIGAHLEYNFLISSFWSILGKLCLYSL